MASPPPEPGTALGRCFCRPAPRWTPLLFLAGAVVVAGVAFAGVVLLDPSDPWTRSLAARAPLQAWGTGLGLVVGLFFLPWPAVRWLRCRYGHARIGPLALRFRIPESEPLGRRDTCDGGERCPLTTSPRAVVIPIAKARWEVTSHGLLAWHRDANPIVRTFFPLLIPTASESEAESLARLLESAQNRPDTPEVVRLLEAILEERPQEEQTD